MTIKKRRLIWFGVVAVLALGFAFLAVNRARPADSFVAGTPWRAKNRLERFNDLMGYKVHGVSYELETSDFFAVRDFFKRRFPQSQGWVHIGGGKKPYYRLEHQTKLGSVIPSETLTINGTTATNGHMMVEYSTPYAATDYWVAFLRTGGRARITKFGPRGAQQSVWP